MDEHFKNYPVLITLKSMLTICYYFFVQVKAVKSDPIEDDNCEDSSFTTITVDEFIHFNVDTETAKLILDLRTKLNSFILRSINIFDWGYSVTKHVCAKFFLTWL